LDCEEQGGDDAGRFYVRQIASVPGVVTANHIAEATLADPDLSRVLKYVKTGWPDRIPERLTTYARKATELAVQGNVILWGRRVVIPQQLRKQVLEELHGSHAGMVRMKSVARMYCYWPNIDTDIEELCRACSQCNLNAREQPAVIKSWPQTEHVWERVHLDYAGPIQGYMMLVLKDVHTGWIEAGLSKTSTSSMTVRMIRSWFARFGLPKVVVTDNGPQFCSEEFKGFLEENGIRHITSPPYHPRSNGEAERTVQTLKSALRKISGDIFVGLDKVLSDIRRSPRIGDKESPAQKLLGYSPRCRLSLLMPIQDRRRELSEEHFSGLEIGKKVWSRNYRDRRKWIPGTVIRRLGTVVYLIQTEHGMEKRHIDQLRPA
jgi:hypothetical protein